MYSDRIGPDVSHTFQTTIGEILFHISDLDAGVETAREKGMDVAGDLPGSPGMFLISVMARGWRIYFALFVFRK